MSILEILSRQTGLETNFFYQGVDNQIYKRKLKKKLDNLIAEAKKMETNGPGNHSNKFEIGKKSATNVEIRDQWPKNTSLMELEIAEANAEEQFKRVIAETRDTLPGKPSSKLLSNSSEFTINSNSE
jgi:hypothetical protein